MVLPPADESSKQWFESSEGLGWRWKCNRCMRDFGSMQSCPCTEDQLWEFNRMENEERQANRRARKGKGKKDTATQSQASHATTPTTKGAGKGQVQQQTAIGERPPSPRHASPPREKRRSRSQRRRDSRRDRKNRRDYSSTSSDSASRSRDRRRSPGRESRITNISEVKDVRAGGTRVSPTPPPLPPPPQVQGVSIETPQPETRWDPIIANGALVTYEEVCRALKNQVTNLTIQPTD